MSLFSADKNSKDEFLVKFEEQLASKRLFIKSIDNNGLVDITQGDVTLKISLENTRRNFERDGDESHISSLVDAIVSYGDDLPGWETAKSKVYVNLFQNDTDLSNYSPKKVTEEFSIVFVYRDNGKLIWIATEDIMKWGITAEELEQQSFRNMTTLLEQATIEFDLIDGRKLAYIESDDETLKAALLFAPGIKAKVEAITGFPFYAVIPVRDFCYLFAEKDADFFVPRIGKVVVDEFTSSGYPVTTEVLRFSKDGVEAKGKYPV